MTERFFVDSNVLVYARDLTDPAKQERADRWIKRFWAMGTARVSYQVLVECYAVLTAPSKKRLPIDQARIYVASFEAWRPAAIDQPLLERAWEVQDRYGFSWWDCLIVAAALVTECTVLLTEDMQHNQDLDGMIVVNPFEVDPESLLQP